MMNTTDQTHRRGSVYNTERLEKREAADRKGREENWGLACWGDRLAGVLLLMAAKCLGRRRYCTV